MKKLILLLMINPIALGFCQTFTLSPDTIEGTYADYEYAYDYIYVNNNSGGNLVLNFTLLSNTCVTNGWYNTMCTSYTCYPGIPSTGTLGTIPDGDQGYFAYHCGFDGIPGDGTMRIRVYESGNPSNADTLTYIYHVYSTAGFSNTVADANINIYPNPVQDILTVKSKEIPSNGVIQITSLSGEVMMQQSLLSENFAFAVNELRPGIYFATIYAGNTKMYSAKFVKQ